MNQLPVQTRYKVGVKRPEEQNHAELLEHPKTRTKDKHEHRVEKNFLLYSVTKAVTL